MAPLGVSYRRPHFDCYLSMLHLMVGLFAVDPEEKPCGTVLESAKIHKDMLTGLVVTSRITHATPAAFSAHVGWRDWENDIALQQVGENPLGRTVDLMFGGGRCQFITNQTQGGCRLDNRNLLQEATSNYGWKTVLDSRKDFDALADDAELPLMGLYTPDVCMHILHHKSQYLYTDIVILSLAHVL